MFGKHKCKGPVKYNGPCEVFLVSKQNHAPTHLYANGKIRICEICKWPFAHHDECASAEANEEKSKCSDATR